MRLKYLISLAILIVAAAGIYWYFHQKTTGAIGPGIITGTVIYPSEIIPPQQVCAESMQTKKTICVDVEMAENQPDFSLVVPPGDYYVFAQLRQPVGDFTSRYRAYFNEFVRCGIQVDCNEALHQQYIPVHVESGSTVTEIQPHDWYAPL